MKSNYLSRTLANLPLALLFLTTTSTAAFSQDKSSVLEEFKLTIEKTGDGINIIGLKGTAWANLTFSLKENQSQAVDEYGMAELNTPKTKDPNQVDFVFTISKSKEEVILTGIKGTAWSKLSFTLLKGEKQTIDQSGTAEILY